MPLTFRYHPAIIQRYPVLAGGVILASGLRNGSTPPELAQHYQQEQVQIKEQIGETPLSSLPALAAWRAAFREFGVDPTQYRCAAEALLRRLTKKGDVPGINTLVDIGNLVSIRYALPVAVFDMRLMTGALTVHFADGSEHFTPLGETELEHPAPGEVVFSDESGMVAARRWCWRQSDESAARDQTTDAIITVEAHHDSAQADVAHAVDDLREMLTMYAGGTLLSGILGGTHAEITVD
ncbi:MAG: phenylalanine--tRNA ligase beta subunit-related protein [Anaerolineae bacterium]